MRTATFAIPTTPELFLSLLRLKLLDVWEALDGCTLDVMTDSLPALATVFVADGRNNTSVDLVIAQAQPGHIGVTVTAAPGSKLLEDFKKFISQSYALPLPMPFLSDADVDAAALSILVGESAPVQPQPAEPKPLPVGRPLVDAYDQAFDALYVSREYKTRRAAFTAIVAPTLGTLDAAQERAAFEAFAAAMNRRLRAHRRNTDENTGKP